MALANDPDEDTRYVSGYRTVAGDRFGFVEKLNREIEEWGLMTDALEMKAEHKVEIRTPQRGEVGDLRPDGALHAGDLEAGQPARPAQDYMPLARI